MQRGSLVRNQTGWHSAQEGKEKPSTSRKGSCLVLELRSSNPSLNPDSKELRALLIPCSHICTAPLCSSRQLLGVLCI